MTSTSDSIYFDDLAVDQVYDFGPYRVVEKEMLEFSRKWDPLPIHLHDQAA